MLDNRDLWRHTVHPARGRRIIDLLVFRCVTAAVLVAGLALPVAALAAEDMPPLPRPRPDATWLQQQATGDNQAPIPAPPLHLPDGAQPPSDAASAIAAVTSVPQPVHLSAKVTDDGKEIPSGLVWRVFDAKADASGDLAMVAKSDKAVADLSLPPGEYVVHVAYGRAQASDTIEVAEGDNSKTLLIDAGALRLNAAVTGDIAIPPELEHFDIFTPGDNDAPQVPVAENVAPNDVVTLNSGTYHVVSYFGSVNAVVRADLRVEPGQMTEATLYHRASQVSFKLVSEAGGEAIADIDWTVKDASGATLFTETGAFPATVLQEGDYEVFARRGDDVYNRRFSVTPGQPREIEVLTTVY
jgi:hypothetical protein